MSKNIPLLPSNYWKKKKKIVNHIKMVPKQKKIKIRAFTTIFGLLCFNPSKNDHCRSSSTLDFSGPNSCNLWFLEALSSSWFISHWWTYGLPHNFWSSLLKHDSYSFQRLWEWDLWEKMTPFTLLVCSCVRHMFSSVSPVDTVFDLVWIVTNSLI